MTLVRFLLNGASLALMASVGACCTWVAFSALDKEPPTDFGSCEVTNSPVIPGGQAIVLCSVWRHRQCSVRAEQIVFDAHDVRYVLDPYRITRTSDVGHRPVKYAFQVPEHAMPGMARYEVARTYVCSVLQNLWPITTPLMMLRFEIAPPPKGAPP